MEELMSNLMSCGLKQTDTFSLLLSCKQIIGLLIDSYVVAIPHTTASLEDMLHVVALFSYGVDDNSHGGTIHLMHENTKEEVEFFKGAIMASVWV